MKRLVATTAFAAAMLLGTGCSPTAGDIYPMTVGSAWNMDLLVMAGATAASLDTFQTGISVNTAVERASLTSGREVVKFKYESSVHQRIPDTSYTSTTYSYYREDGDWILGYSTLGDSTADTVMTTNPAVGRTWQQGAGSAEVIGREDVTVKAGVYKNAWKVRLTTNQGGVPVDMYLWYAMGTGLVKMHYEGENLGYTVVYDQELTSATIK
jgi:hypothetical protein